MRTSIARLIAVLTTVLLPVVLLPSPADAAVVTIISRTGTSAGNPSMHVATTLCQFPDPTSTALPGSVDRVPMAGALGTASLRIQQGQQPNLQSGVSFDARSLSSLAVFRARIRTSAPSMLFWTIRVDQADTSWVGYASTPGTVPENTWHVADGMSRNYQWVEQPGGEEREEPAMTIASFLSLYGGGQATGFIGAGPCNGFTATTVYVDDFRVSAGANTQVFDFEMPFIPTVGIATSSTAITHGGSVRVTGSLKYQANPLPGRVMRLYAQVGSAQPTVVATRTTSSSGQVAATLSPTRNTTYTWYFAEAGNYGSKFSGARYVGVRPRVTLTLADSTLHSGQTLVATGRITPAKVDQVATLWRQTSSGPVKLGSVTLSRTDGTYRISKVLSARGTYKVYVTVPAATGNLKGTSPIRTATVS